MVHLRADVLVLYLCVWGVCASVAFGRTVHGALHVLLCRQYWPDLAEAWHGLFKATPHRLWPGLGPIMSCCAEAAPFQPTRSARSV